jgi:hypothetical protein
MSRPVVCACVLACVLALAALASAEPKARFDNYRVYTVVATSEPQLAVLRALQDTVHGVSATWPCDLAVDRRPSR